MQEPQKVKSDQRRHRPLQLTQMNVWCVVGFDERNIILGKLRRHVLVTLEVGAEAAAEDKG
jgi:hypothetical protein